ncbi:hypothetical protein BH23PLA1_BH23PLA1_38890 [soil metagenome]
MADHPHPSDPHTDDHASMGRPTVQAPLPITPGKVAMWLFLATEVMFFTGLIGSYIVLRSGSPPDAYSNLFAPGTDLTYHSGAQGVVVKDVGPDEHRLVEIIHEATGKDVHDIEHQLEVVPTLETVVGVASPGIDAGPFEQQLRTIEQLAADLKSAGATIEVQGIETYQWPEPYITLVNPLSIDLTAVNTFILICSSVTMVLALAAVQRGDKRKLSLYLLATILIGSLFLGIQVYEYYQLLIGHHYTVGVSPTGHFTPDVSLFASCFFTMTGFHGAHVTGGVVLLIIIWIQSLRSAYSVGHHAPVEMAGLYWHFVDLVWIILFTVVYLI